jgi:hypothetical protein
MAAQSTTRPLRSRTGGAILPLMESLNFGRLMLTLVAARPKEKIALRQRTRHFRFWRTADR